jgi:hypothetical protein
MELPMFPSLNQLLTQMLAARKPRARAGRFLPAVEAFEDRQRLSVSARMVGGEDSFLLIPFADRDIGSHTLNVTTSELEQDRVVNF